MLVQTVLDPVPVLNWFTLLFMVGFMAPQMRGAHAERLENRRQTIALRADIATGC